MIGVPSAGKSKGSGHVFSQLKMKGYKAEYVQEFAKDMVYDGNKEAFKNQAYIFGNQYYRQSRLNGKVNYIITDSPLILSILYNNGNKALEGNFNKTVFDVFNSFNNINYLIRRVEPYEADGRLQNEEESDALVEPLLKLLYDYQVPYYTVDGNEAGYDKIVNDIIARGVYEDNTNKW
jgi:hypothetical protein